MKYELTIFLLISVFVLAGCGTNEITPTESFTSDEIMQEFVQDTVKESISEISESADAIINIDIQKLLTDAEENAAELQKRLTEDASLKQSDMNQISYDIYVVWDDLLNELWGILQDTLDKKTMNDLLAEQRSWIETKESAVKKAGEIYNGGSMAPLASNQKAAEMTKIRVYELAEYLTSE